MAQTVIGLFDNSSKAQAAVSELVASGISRDSIDVSGSGNTGSYSSTGTSDLSGSGEEHESGISKFFKNLFGDDDDDATKYSSVASKSQSIVTVHLQDNDQAERVADILDDNGAINVDEHAAKYGYSNTTGSTSGSDLGAGAAGAAGVGLSSLGSAATGSTGLGTTTGDADYAIGSGSTGTGISGTDYTGTTGTSDYSTSATAGTAGTTGTGVTGDDFSDAESRKIPIIEENLEVGKREIQTGGVRLRSRIIERPVEESVRLREERVNIERTPVDRAVSATDLENFKERDIELVEHAEVPVVNKTARVVEEVSVGKEVEERNETVKDTVRKTEVDIENLESNNNPNRLNTNSGSGTTSGNL